VPRAVAVNLPSNSLLGQYGVDLGLGIQTFGEQPSEVAKCPAGETLQLEHRRRCANRFQGRGAQLVVQLRLVSQHDRKHVVFLAGVQS
jgi:hypothetical protein